jgi:hypothetical protein
VLSLEKYKSLIWSIVIFLVIILAVSLRLILNDGEPKADPLPPPKGGDLYTFVVHFEPIYMERSQLDVGLLAGISFHDVVNFREIQKNIQSDLYSPTQLMMAFQEKPSSYWMNIANRRKAHLERIQNKALTFRSQINKLASKRNKIVAQHAADSYIALIREEIKLAGQLPDVLKAVDPMQQFNLTGQNTKKNVSYLPQNKKGILGVQLAYAEPQSNECVMNSISPSGNKNTYQCPAYTAFKQTAQKIAQLEKKYKDALFDLKKALPSELPASFIPPDNPDVVRRLVYNGLLPSISNYYPKILTVGKKRYVVPSYGGRAVLVVNEELAGESHPKTGVHFDKYGFPVFRHYIMLVMPEDDILDPKSEHESLFNVDLAQNRLHKGSELEVLFRKKYKDKFDEVVRNMMKGKNPPGMVWHYYEQFRMMQLVDAKEHEQTEHTCGYDIWGAGQFKKGR